MSDMKAFAKKISVDMGFNGELNELVLQEANRILKDYGLDRHVLSMPVPEMDLSDVLKS